MRMPIIKSNPARQTKSFSIALIVVWLAVTTFGQASYIKGEYHLPKQHRQVIISRLNLFIEYERAGQYALQYDLIDKEVARSNGWTKEEYAQQQKERAARIGVIQAISVEHTIRFDENNIGIGGIAKMIYKNQKVSQSIGIVANLQNGQWYFGFGFPET